MKPANSGRGGKNRADEVNIATRILKLLSRKRLLNSCPGLQFFESGLIKGLILVLRLLLLPLQLLGKAFLRFKDIIP